MPWRVFALRAALGLAIVVPPLSYALNRWGVAVDPQVRRCLPDVRTVLIDRHALEPRRGQIAVFVADPDRHSLFKPGSLVGKVVVGLPGDRVVVTPDETTVNGRLVGRGLLVAEVLGVPAEALARELVVPAAHLWVMGATGDSFDSRYWGPLPAAALRGTAHVLF
jgi:conjugal transfer pilin signal peptidase TrbI